MRRLATALLLLAVAGGARASPSPMAGGGPGLDLPVERVITNPDWVKLPDANDMAHFYPQIAAVIGIGGRAVLHCTVAVDGSLGSCAVVSETPGGMGFGEAALAMAGKFQMRPATIDGRPVGNGQINIPIRFAPSDDAMSPADAAADQGPPPDPKTLALAQRVAQLIRWDDGIAAADARYASQLAVLSQQQGLTPQQTAALDAARTAEDHYLRSRYEARVAKVAQDFSPDQLQRLIDLFENPTAQLWFSRVSALDQAGAENPAAAHAGVMKYALRRFCQQATCFDAAAPAPAK
jgi:TonB family protein